MFEFKLGFLLVIIVISFTITHANADPLLLEFDKSYYSTGDSISITGQVYDLKMPVIAISIYDTNGKILSANNVEVESDGSFTKTFFLDSPFYEKSGKYKVKLDYGKISHSEFFTIDNQDSPPKTTITSFVPEIASLQTDKPTYTDNELITIYGTVSVLDSPTVLIGIYDTFGTPSGFYFGQVDSNLKFSTIFLAKAGVNFKVDGTYSIKAHYAESSKTIPFDFSLKKISADTVPVSINKNITQNADTPTNKPKPNESANQGKTKTIKANETLKDNKSTNKPIVPNTSQQISNAKKELTDDYPYQSLERLDKNKIQSHNENKKENNLTVEDIELGLMLNQINLECDKSKYVDTISYYDGMGPALYRLCKFDSSLNFFNDALVKEPNNVEILSNKGSALAKLGFNSEAVVYYDYALRINPDFLPALNNKANALANIGSHDEAKLLYELALEKNPDYVTVIKNLSLLNSELSKKPHIESEKILHFIDSKETIKFEEKEPIETQNHLVQQERQDNFFDEVRLAFSSLGSLFGLLR